MTSLYSYFMKSLAKEVIILNKLDVEGDSSKIEAQFQKLKQHVDRLMREHQNNKKIQELLQQLDSLITLSIRKAMPFAKSYMYQTDIGQMRILLNEAFKELKLEIDDEIKELKEIGVVPGR